MNARSYYRWSLDLTVRIRNKVSYTPGHEGNVSHPSILNHEADYWATESQNFAALLPIAPTPTFAMDTYTFYSDKDQWIESNIQEYIIDLLAHTSARNLAQEKRF